MSLSLYFFISLCFNTVSFRGQKKPGPRPDWSPLGVKFKIFDEHSSSFYMGVSQASMQMIAPHFSRAPAPAVSFRSDDQAAIATRPTSSVALKKKNRWTEIEENILIELFGENEDKLRYITWAI